MVLRFSCPCGAPYTLADHLAGRTFTCTKCGVVLQIGSPAAPPPSAPAAPPPSSDGLLSSMEWSSEQKRPSGLGVSGAGLRPLDDDERRGASQRTKKPADDAPLALADEDEDEAGEEDEAEEEAEDEAPEPPRRSGRSDLRTSKSSSRLKTSGTGPNLRTSGVTKGGGANLRTSAVSKGASGRQGKGRASADDGPAASRSCPVCEAQISAAAVVCPSCGVRLKERSAIERMVEGGAWQGPAKALAFLGLAGVLGFGVWSVMSKDQRPPGRLPTAANRPGPKDPGGTGGGTTPSTPTGQTPTATATEQGAPATTERATGSATETPPKDPAGPGDEEEPPSSTEPTTSPGTPRVRPPRDPAPTGPGRPSDAAREEVAIVPPGPLEADFKRLRDATSSDEVQSVIAALAGKPGLDEPLQRALKSLDRTYCLRLHRVRLAAGDEAKRRATIEASLKGDGGLALVYTVLAAVDLDAEGFRAQVQSIGYDGDDRLVGRTWADAVIEKAPPRSGALEALGRAFDAADEEGKRLLAPALALGGDGRGLGRCCEALAHESPAVRGLARAGLEAIAAGTGPGGDDPAAWRAWAEAYAPLRDLLARACAEPDDLAAHVAARRELVARAREVIPILPVFVQEAPARTAHAARTIGDLLALAGGPADAPALKAVLGALRGDLADHGVHIVWGAMLACDDAVADEAAQAVIRGAVKLDDAALLPELSRPAPARTQEALATWVRSLGPAAQPKGRLAAAAFRCGWLEAWLLEESQADRSGRGAIGARLASARVEKALLEVAEGGSAPAAFPSLPEALVGLGEFGTEAAADRLAKLAGDAPTAELLRALMRLGDARHARRLKKQVDSIADGAVGASLFDTYARLLGADAAGALAKRARDDDPMYLVARPVLLRLGGREARELARRPFEALTGKPDQRIPTVEETQAFVRSGTADDAQLFKRLLIVFDQVAPVTRREILLGFGVMGYKDGLSIVEGYINDGHRERALGAVSAAMLGATSTVERMKDLALRGRNPETINVENALVVAALATLSADEGREVARRYVPAAMNRILDEATTAIAFALARADDDEGLRPLARASEARVRAAAARGIALAALSRREGIAALPVLDDLRLDPAPEVRAEAAVARGVLCLEGAARDVLVALAGPDEVLDAAGRGYGGPGNQTPSLLSSLAATEDLTSLRHALWVAYDAATPGEGPAFRAELGRGRQRELVREALPKVR